MGSPATVEQDIKISSWVDVLPAPDLVELSKQGKTFRLVNYENNFSSFYLMEKNVEEDGLFFLREEIMETLQQEQVPKKFGQKKALEAPTEKLLQIGQVWLAPNPSHKNEYQRVVIEKVHYAVDNLWKVKGGAVEKEETTVTAYFFDFGGSYKIKMSDLKPITKVMMRVPALSYKVHLYSNTRLPVEPFSSNGLILMDKFRDFMDTVKKYDMTVVVRTEQMGNPMTQQAELRIIYPVSLSYMAKDKKTTLLMDKLNELMIWEWETTALNAKDEKVDDDFILKHGLLGEAGNEVTTYLASPGTEFSAIISRVSLVPGNDRKNCVELRAILLDEALHRNYHVVLHNQMDRYACKVDKFRKFNPVIGKQVFLFKLDKSKEFEKKRVWNLGKWSRAILMESNWVYLIDWDQNIPLDGVEKDDYEMRPLYGEFLQIPSLIVFLTPLRNGTPIRYDNAKQMFAPRHFYKFRITDVADGVVHKAEYLGPAESEFYGDTHRRVSFQIGADSDSTSSGESEH